MIRKIIMYIRFQERIYIIPDIRFRRNVNAIVKKFDWVFQIFFLFVVVEICKEK